MEKNTDLDAVVPLLGADWFDSLEAGERQRIRSLIEAMLESARIFIDFGQLCSSEPTGRFHDFDHPFSNRTAHVGGELSV